MKLGKTMFASLATLVMATGIVGCSSDDSMPSYGSSGATASPTPAAGTLYTRLGSNAGIATAVHAIVVQELMDPELASYFFFQVQKPIPAGHPSADQIEACLVLMLGNAAGGPEVYPGTVAGGFQCRGMTAAHASLGIPGGVFTKFNTVAAGVLKTAGVSDDDIKVVGGVLEAQRGEVAQDTTRDTGNFVQKQQ
jgi:hypothetical protein